ncbi:hypothetical protein D083_3316 [Dickeya solani RNS 08.23.3.1.A]|nr:hypothetical protein D083_3316 [Dickeya solani RNS 08.23.3.1.A]
MFSQFIFIGDHPAEINKPTPARLNSRNTMLSRYPAINNDEIPSDPGLYPK